MLLTCITHVQAGGSPFYEIKVVAKPGDLTEGGGAYDVYIDWVYDGVTLNDSGLTAFRSDLVYTNLALIGLDGLVAENATRTGVQRLEDYLFSSGDELTFSYRDLRLNNDNHLLATFGVPFLSRCTVCAVLDVFDATIQGGAKISSPGGNPIRVSASSLCDECFGAPPGDSCSDVFRGSIDDDGNVVFVAYRSQPLEPLDTCDGSSYNNFLYYDPPGSPETNISHEITEVSPDTNGFTSIMAASGHAAVLKQGTGSLEEILYVDPSGTDQTLASAAGGWTQIGRHPTISPDGFAVAFAGKDAGGVKGIFLSLFDELGPLNSPTRIIDTNTVIAHLDSITPIMLGDFDHFHHTPVIHHDVGADGDFIGDSIIIAFMALPTSASRDNPAAAPGTPLLFSDELGIWTVRVDIERELGNPSNVVINAHGPLPVIQIGDMLDGQEITELSLGNGLGRATHDTSGVLRTNVVGNASPGDHYLAFWAKTTNGVPMVVKAAKLDTDDDGLMDHWERPGGGIDMDRDGIVDLDLSAWGTQVEHKDLFLEIDWGKSRTSGTARPWNNAPAAVVTDLLVAMFQAAPVTNADGSTGILLHVDAGSGSDPELGFGYSWNTGSGSLQGGDLIGSTQNQHLDIISFGSTAVSNVPGIVTRDFHEIKDSFFGTTDKRARELVFRYCVLSDFIDVLRDGAGNPIIGAVASATSRSMTPVSLPVPTNTPAAIMITQGQGAGQIMRNGLFVGSRYNCVEPWGVMPNGTSQFVLLHTAGGQAEALIRSTNNNHSLPGNDMIITLGGRGVTSGLLGSTADQWKTIAHEIGHTLGLRHGGNDNCQYKGQHYASLMSYSHQLRHFSSDPLINNDVPPTGVVTSAPVVNSYSDSSDPTFDDWSYLRYSTYDTLEHVGNTFLRAAGAAEFEEFDLENYVETFGRFPNDSPPGIQTISPANETVIPPGGSLSVDLQAYDDFGVQSVVVSFDIDGDGAMSGAGESIPATDLGAGQYSAVFTNVSGAAGPREVRLLAEDIGMNFSLSKANVLVGGGSSGDSRAPFSPNWYSPGHNEIFQKTTWLFVDVDVTDFRDDFSSGIVDSVLIFFDVDGDGLADDQGEFQSAFRSEGSRWQAQFPAISGPVGSRSIQVRATDNWLNSVVSFRTINIIDLDATPPSVTIINPAPGSSIELGDQLAMEALVTDSGTIDRVTMRFDNDGNGITFGCEVPVASTGGGGLYTATSCFGGLTGPVGPRLVTVEAKDIVGNVTTATQSVNVVDSTAPGAAFESPAAGTPYGVGATLTVDLDVTDAGGGIAVQVVFDIDGDGMTTSPGESVVASHLGGGNYRAVFANISGPTGSRTISVEAVDASSNMSVLNHSISIVSGSVVRSPSDLDPVALSGTFRIDLEGAVGITISEVLVRFDINGDGDTSDEGETIVAASLLEDRLYAVDFSNLSGDFGLRDVEIIVMDGVMNAATTTVQVAVGPFRGHHGIRSRHIAYVPLLPEALSDDTQASSFPENLVEACGLVFFSALDGISGRELWRSDGTASGTWMVKEFEPGGSLAEFGGSLIDNLVEYNGELYFTATDWSSGTIGVTIPAGLIGNELWKTDGTPSGTALVKDIYGPPTAVNEAPRSSDPKDLTVFNGSLYFSAWDAVNGRELWMSDGSEGGTVFLDVDPGPGGTFLDPEYLTVVETTLFFAAISGRELWKTDGSMVGTVRVKDGFPANGIENPAPAGDRLFFSGSGELWISDGSSTGTVEVKDIRPSGSSNPVSLIDLNGQLYFTADDGSHGREVWKSDGTDTGTVMVLDIRPGSFGSDPADLMVFDGHLFFTADDAANGRELWKTDGTDTGTVIAVNIAAFTGTETSAPYPTRSSAPQFPAIYNNEIYFSADDGTGDSGRELWKTDGTPGGTTLVRDLDLTRIPNDPNFPSTFWSASSSPRNHLVANGLLYFAASGPYGCELWKSDGTAAGTVKIRNISHGVPSRAYSHDDSLYFSAGTTSHGYELWRGGSNGIFMVKDLHANEGDASPSDFATLAGDLLFSATDDEVPFSAPDLGLFATEGSSTGTVKLADLSSFGNPIFPGPQNIGTALLFRATSFNGEELWGSDGSPSGTLELKDINPGFSDSDPAYPAPINGTLFFSADGPDGREPWKSDGTPTGTLQVADVNPGPGDGNPGRFTLFNGEIYFIATDGSTGHELWKTDGTPGGSQQIMDLNPGSNSAFTFVSSFLLEPLVIFNGHLYFSAIPSNNVPGFWKSDGTAMGTELLKEIKPGALDPETLTLKEEFVEAGGVLYFAGDGPQGIELYKTDGTSNGTVQVRNISGLDPTGSFETGSEPRGLVALNGSVLFTAFDYVRARELWRSDGTAPGTIPLADILPGFRSSEVGEITRLGDLAFFTAKDDEHGRELWMTDGTPEGTQMVEDLLPGPSSSNPKHLVVHEGELLYYADAGALDLSLRRLNPTNNVYDNWLDAETSLAGADRNPLADPNSNGIPNYIEFFVDGDPEGSGSILGPELIGMTATGSFLEAEYQRRIGTPPQEVQYVMEKTTNLQTWVESNVMESSIQLDPEFEQITIRLADPANTNDAHAAIRLKIRILP